MHSWTLLGNLGSHLTGFQLIFHHTPLLELLKTFFKTKKDKIYFIQTLSCILTEPYFLFYSFIL